MLTRQHSQQLLRGAFQAAATLPATLLPQSSALPLGQPACPSSLQDLREEGSSLLGEIYQVFVTRSLSQGALSAGCYASGPRAGRGLRVWTLSVLP